MEDRITDKDSASQLMEVLLEPLQGLLLPWVVEAPVEADGFKVVWHYCFKMGQIVITIKWQSIMGRILCQSALGVDFITLDTWGGRLLASHSGITYTNISENVQ